MKNLSEVQMKISMKLGTIAVLTLFVSFMGTAWGSQFVAPAMTSKVVNFSDLANEKIEVSASVTCNYNFQGDSCGVDHATTTVNSQGDFSLPELKVAHSSWMKLNFEASIVFKIGELTFTREFREENEYVAFLKQGVFVLTNNSLSFHIVPKNGETFSKWYSSQVKGRDEYLVVEFSTFKNGMLDEVYSAQVNGSTDHVQLEKPLFQVLSSGEPLSYSIEVFKPYFVGSDGPKTIYENRGSVDTNKLSDFTLDVP